MKSFFVFLSVLLNFAVRAQVASSLPSTPVNKELLLQLVNNARKKGCRCGEEWFGPVPALTWNKQLEAAATAHSQDMLQNRYFSHTAPDGSGSGQRIEAAGYAWRNFGENIASGYPTEGATIEGWLNSPGHCRNIMSKDFREMAVGRAGTYWTQTFGTPR